MESGRVAACEKRKLYVANLRGGITAEELVKQFSQFGAVTEAHILNRMGRGGRLSGFVTFQEPKSALAAVDKLKDWCPDNDGEKVTIKLADVKGSADDGPECAKKRQPPYKLYVSNLPPASTVEYVQEIFEVYGEITNCYMLFTRGRGNRKSCFVTFEDLDSAMRALDGLSDQLFDDEQRLTVRWADPPKKEQAEPKRDGKPGAAKSDNRPSTPTTSAEKAPPGMNGVTPTSIIAGAGMGAGLGGLNGLNGFGNGMGMGMNGMLNNMGMNPMLMNFGNLQGGAGAGAGAGSASGEGGMGGAPQPVQLLVNGLDNTWTRETLTQQFNSYGELMDVQFGNEIQGLRSATVTVRPHSADYAALGQLATQMASQNVIVTMGGMGGMGLGNNMLGAMGAMGNMGNMGNMGGIDPTMAGMGMGMGMGAMPGMPGMGNMAGMGMPGMGNMAGMGMPGMGNMAGMGMGMPGMGMDMGMGIGGLGPNTSSSAAADSSTPAPSNTSGGFI